MLNSDQRGYQGYQGYPGQGYLPGYPPFYSNNTYQGYRFLLYMIIAVIFIFLISDWCNRNNRQYSKQVKQGVNDIVKESSKISTSAKQNQNALLSLMQNSEALGMMKAVKLLAPEQDIQQLTNGVPISETEREIKEQQSESAKIVLKKCADFLPQSRLAELAGLYPYAASASLQQQPAK